MGEEKFAVFFIIFLDYKAISLPIFYFEFCGFGVEPKKPAYVTEIGNDLNSMKEAVGGYIEPIYYLEDPRAVMVGNEEAKLIGLEGNRRFGNRIVAGTFFICGILEDDFDSLPDDLCEKYVKEFAEPQDISPDEVQRDTGCFVFSW